MNKLSILGLIVLVVSGPLLALDPSIAQLAISVAPGWDSPSGKLQLFEREGNGWRATSPPLRVLYGKNGLAWGRGVLGMNEPGCRKPSATSARRQAFSKLELFTPMTRPFRTERGIHFTLSRKPTPGSTTRTCRTTINMSSSIPRIRRRGLKSKKCV